MSDATTHSAAVPESDPASSAAEPKLELVDRGILLFLIALFVFAAIDKILHYDGFVNALRDYRMIPRWTAHYIAAPVILVELLIGLGLVFRPWRRPAALTAAITMASFALILGVNHWLGGRGICGCWFTITLAQSTSMHIVQNLMFSALAGLLWLALRSDRSPNASDDHQPPQGGKRSS